MGKESWNEDGQLDTDLDETASVGGSDPTADAFASLAEEGTLQDAEGLFDMLEIVQDEQNTEDKIREENREQRGSRVEDGSVKSEDDKLIGFGNFGPEDKKSEAEQAYEDLVGELEEEDQDLIREDETEEEVPDVPLRYIEDYDPLIYSQAQLDEIDRGIHNGVDVTRYDDPALMFRQMREIRIGLEQGVDVSFYANRYFKDRQMRELRLALMEGFDVTTYARLIYSFPDMERHHREAAQAKFDQNPGSCDVTYTDRETKITILTREGQSEAYIVPGERLPMGYSTANLEALLHIYGITEGLCLDKLPKNLAGLTVEKEYLVAQAIPSIIGRDGYYEYPVEHFGEDRLKIREDGTIDYQGQRVFTGVKTGQLVAVYHPAILGKRGLSVMGLELPAYSGRNLQRPDLKNVRIDPDGEHYYAIKDGYLSVQEGDPGQIHVEDVLEFREDLGYANGNIRFDGNIHIFGNVNENAMIEADGNIVVEGFVGSAILKAGGDIIVSRGCNGNDRGILSAEGHLTAAFLENVHVRVKGNVKAGYVLNSDVECGGVLTTEGKMSQLCGGRIRATGGVETDVVGNDTHIRTSVECGYAQELEGNLQLAVRKKRKIDKEMAAVQGGINRLIQRMGVEKGRNHSVYIKLQDVLELQSRESEELEKQIGEMRAALDEAQKVRVAVRKTAYADTRLRINGVVQVLQADVIATCFVNRNGAIEKMDYVASGR